jgi:hypothetical protein
MFLFKGQSPIKSFKFFFLIGTWGPPEADWIVKGDGGWYNPKPEEAIG